MTNAIQLKDKELSEEEIQKQIDNDEDLDIQTEPVVSNITNSTTNLTLTNNNQTAVVNTTGMLANITNALELSKNITSLKNQPAS